MAYFNNAATTYPKPEVVYESMDAFYRNNLVSVGRGNNQGLSNADSLLKETRELVKTVLNCLSKEVVFVPTATIALNIIIQGVINSGIRNVYISPFEHNSVVRVLHNFEKKGIINVFELCVSNTMEYDLERIKYQFDEKKPEFVIVSHASNVTGLVAPIEKIFNLAKEYEAITLVDMAQTAGLIDCNVGAEEIDYAVFAGHKTLYGPTGISGFIMKKNCNLEPILFGGTGFDSANLDMPNSLPEKYEIGTLNMVGIAGLNASLKWICEKSINEIRKKEIENRNKLISILKKYWFVKLIGIQKDRKYVGVVSFVIDGISSDSIGNILENLGISLRSGLQCAPNAHKFLNTYPSGTIRVSVSYFNSDDDFKELEKALNFIEENI